MDLPQFLEFRDATGRRHLVNVQHISSIREYRGADHTARSPQTVIELVSGSTFSLLEPMEEVLQLLGVGQGEK